VPERLRLSACSTKGVSSGCRARRPTANPGSNGPGEAAEALTTVGEIIDAVTRLLPNLGFF